MTIRDALRQHPFTHVLTEPEREELAQFARLRSTRAGEYLMREGQVCPGLFLLLSGQAEVELHVGSAGSRQLQSLGPGDAAGWSWALPPYKSAFDVRISRPSEVVELSGPDLRALGDTSPALAYRLMIQLLALLSERLRNTRYQVADLY